MTTTSVSKPRVTREPVEVSIARLQAFVFRMEHRYERLTADVIRSVEGGEIHETAEIAKWILSYRTLESLRNGGSTTGTPMSSTA